MYLRVSSPRSSATATTPHSLILTLLHALSPAISSSALSPVSFSNSALSSEPWALSPEPHTTPVPSFLQTLQPNHLCVHRKTSIFPISLPLKLQLKFSCVSSPSPISCPKKNPKEKKLMKISAGDIKRWLWFFYLFLVFFFTFQSLWNGCQTKKWGNILSPQICVHKVHGHGCYWNQTAQKKRFAVNVFID